MSPTDPRSNHQCDVAVVFGAFSMGQTKVLRAEGKIPAANYFTETSMVDGNDQGGNKVHVYVRNTSVHGVGHHKLVLCMSSISSSSMMSVRRPDVTTSGADGANHGGKSSTSKSSISRPSR